MQIGSASTFSRRNLLLIVGALVSRGDRRWGGGGGGFSASRPRRQQSQLSCKLLENEDVGHCYSWLRFFFNLPSLCCFSLMLVQHLLIKRSLTHLFFLLWAAWSRRRCDQQDQRLSLSVSSKEARFHRNKKPVYFLIIVIPLIWTQEYLTKTGDLSFLFYSESLDSVLLFLSIKCCIVAKTVRDMTLSIGISII